MNPHPLHNHDGHINVISGRKVSLLDPQPGHITIMDITRGLAYRPHFGGHSPHFFSVAEHTLMVTKLTMEAYPGAEHAHLWMVAMLHDASEAYLGDMVKPLKVHMPDFQKLEEKMTAAIFLKYKLNPADIALIKPFDKAVQEIEYECFYNNNRSAGLHFYTPKQAFEKFIELWSTLTADL